MASILEGILRGLGGGISSGVGDRISRDVGDQREERLFERERARREEKRRQNLESIGSRMGIAKQSGESLDNYQARLTFAGKAPGSPFKTSLGAEGRLGARDLTEEEKFLGGLPPADREGIFRAKHFSPRGTSIDRYVATLPESIQREYHRMKLLGDSPDAFELAEKINRDIQVWERNKSKADTPPIVRVEGAGGGGILPPVQAEEIVPGSSVAPDSSGVLGTARGAVEGIGGLAIDALEGIGGGALDAGGAAANALGLGAPEVQGTPEVQGGESAVYNQAIQQLKEKYPQIPDEDLLKLQQIMETQGFVSMEALEADLIRKGYL